MRKRISSHLVTYGRPRASQLRDLPTQHSKLADATPICPVHLLLGGAATAPPYPAILRYSTTGLTLCSYWEAGQERIMSWSCKRRFEACRMTHQPVPLLHDNEVAQTPQKYCCSNILPVMLPGLYCCPTSASGLLGLSYPSPGSKSKSPMAGSLHPLSSEASSRTLTCMRRLFHSSTGPSSCS